MHVYRHKNTQNGSDSEHESEPESEPESTFESDGVFALYENLEEFKRCTILNNTICEKGFAEVIQEYQNQTVG
jgi:hypothetical protein